MKFQVTLGFNQTTVEAESSLEAIEKARKVFCEVWPNHTDMIRAKPDSAFKVEQLCAALLVATLLIL